MKTGKNFSLILMLLLPMIFLVTTVLAAKGPAGIGTQRGPDKQLTLSLVTVDTANAESFVDGLLVRYNNGYLLSVADDNVKVPSSDENIASYREGLDLSEEKKPLFAVTDTILLHLTNTGLRNYRFKISMQNFSLTRLVAKLDDNYLHTSSLLDTDGATDNIDFTVNADPASADPFRFRIVFIMATSLPLTITSFTAWPQADNILLNWKVSNQLNILYYEVERSTKGIYFSKLASQPATGNGGTQNYNWLDTHPLTGLSFYRIRCVGMGGDITYSTVVNVKAGKINPGIHIYPNPVINNTILLQFSDMEKGSYGLKLVNAVGQTVFTQQLGHTGGSVQYAPSLIPVIQPGNYFLEILNPDHSKTIRLLIKN